MIETRRLKKCCNFYPKNFKFCAVKENYIYHFYFVSQSVSTSFFFHFHFYLVTEFEIELYALVSP